MYITISGRDKKLLYQLNAEQLFSLIQRAWK